jgi:hypothetical protein
VAWKVEAIVQSKAALIFVQTLVLIGLKQCLTAQDLAENGLPEAPIPEMRAVASATMPAASRPQRHRWINPKNGSIAVLFAGEAFDSWTTYNNLNHHKWICGYSPAFGNAVTYISDDGKVYDPATIQNDLCGPSPSGQQANYAYDVTRTGAFTETGWTTSLRLTGSRDSASVIAWNIADDLGQVLAARYLSNRLPRRDGLFRRIAPAINFARAIVHIDCGIQNLQFARHHSNPSSWDFNLPNQAVLYPAPRWWGRH